MRVGIISKKEHAATLQQRLKAEGYTADVLGDNPDPIPDYDVLVVRTISCSHVAASRALTLKNKGKTVFFESGTQKIVKLLADASRAAESSSPAQGALELVGGDVPEEGKVFITLSKFKPSLPLSTRILVHTLDPLMVTAFGRSDPIRVQAWEATLENGKIHTDKVPVPLSKVPPPPPISSSATDPRHDGVDERMFGGGKNKTPRRDAVVEALKRIARPEGVTLGEIAAAAGTSKGRVSSALRKCRQVTAKGNRSARRFWPRGFFSNEAHNSSGADSVDRSPVYGKFVYATFMVGRGDWRIRGRGERRNQSFGSVKSDRDAVVARVAELDAKLALQTMVVGDFGPDNTATTVPTTTASTTTASLSGVSLILEDLAKWLVDNHQTSMKGTTGHGVIEIKLASCHLNSPTGPACGTKSTDVVATTVPDKVTCKTCRNTEMFKTLSWFLAQNKVEV